MRVKNLFNVEYVKEGCNPPPINFLCQRGFSLLLLLLLLPPSSLSIIFPWSQQLTVIFFPSYALLLYDIDDPSTVWSQQLTVIFFPSYALLLYDIDDPSTVEYADNPPAYESDSESSRPTSPSPQAQASLSSPPLYSPEGICTESYALSQSLPRLYSSSSPMPPQRASSVTPDSSRHSYPSVSPPGYYGGPRDGEDGERAEVIAGARGNERHVGQVSGMRERAATTGSTVLQGEGGGVEGGTRNGGGRRAVGLAAAVVASISRALSPSVPNASAPLNPSSSVTSSISTDSAQPQLVASGSSSFYSGTPYASHASSSTTPSSSSATQALPVHSGAIASTPNVSVPTRNPISSPFASITRPVPAQRRGNVLQRLFSRASSTRSDSAEV